MSSKPPSDSSSGSQKGSSGQGKSQPKPFEPTTTQDAKKPGSKKPDKKADKLPKSTPIAPSQASVIRFASDPNRTKSNSTKSGSAKSSTVGQKTNSKNSRPNTNNRGLSGIGIPETVSRRMVKRMAFFSGIPTALGMTTFVVSYFIVTQELFDLPTYAVLLVSLGFFGLGVLGLSYGVLSSSWEEEMPGSPLGFAEFSTNWTRMTEAWRSQKKP